MLKRGTWGIVAMALIAWSAVPAHAAIVTYNLLDHLDGTQSPPPYGLRLDGLYNNGVHSFSFDHPNISLLMEVDTDALTVRIFGALHGGKDAGNVNSYTYEADWAFDFTYSSGVSVSGEIGNELDPLVVEVNGNPNSMDHGSGTLSVTGNISGGTILAGDVFNLVGKSDDSGLYFRYAKDDHRLDCTGMSTDDDIVPGICDRWVGRGWLQVSSATGIDPNAANVSTPGHTQAGTPKFTAGGTRDFLFTGDVETRVAEPVTLALVGFGLVGIGLARRRRP